MKNRVEIHNALVFTGQRVIGNGFVGINGAVIETVCEMKQSLPQPGARVIDARGGLVMPGLVNAHTHTAMTLMRGVGSDLTLQPWLDIVWKAEERLTGPIVSAGAMLAMMEMIRCGVTAFADMYYFMDDIARAVSQTGLRASLCRGLVFDEGARLSENAELFRAWHGAEGGRIHVMLGPHAEYTTNPEYLRKVIDTAREIGAGLHVHISETRREHDECIGRRGVTPVRYFDGLGMFERPTLAAHCVMADEGDIEILAERGVTVAHCPVSNMKLACGVAPAPSMARAGVRLALGTDSVCSNNRADMFEEIKLCSILHKGVTGDPTIMPAIETLRLATEGGARALGFSDVGEIAPGMRADIIALDPDSPALCPIHDPLAQLVYSATGQDVRMTMVDGNILYLDGQYKTLDAARVLALAREAAGKLGIKRAY